MFTYIKKQLPKHTKEFAVQIEWQYISQKKEESLTELAASISAPGFRKGKTPKEVAVKYISPEKVYERAIRKVLPELYKELVDKENLKPVTSPSVELTEAKENETWKITVQIAEIPEVKLKDYKAAIKKAHKKAQTEAVSHKEDTNSENKKVKKVNDTNMNEKKADEVHAPLSDIFTVLLEQSTCEIPDLLATEEVNRRLSQLVDDTRRVGLTLDQYLSSKQTTMEELKNRLTKESEEMYQIEFILAKIAELEGLKVEQKELDAILNNAQTDQEKQVAKSNMSWYETLLKKQKVIDFLNSL